MLNIFKESALKLMDKDPEDDDIFSINLIEKSVFSNFLILFHIAKYLTLGLWGTFDDTKFWNQSKINPDEDI